MILGIDATNLRLGGGTTHLVNLLENFRPGMGGIERVSVWASSAVLGRLADREWLDKRTDPLLEGGLKKRYVWLLTRSRGEFSRRCDILYSPGGLYFGGFRPYVTMSRNMLLFDKGQRRRLDPAMRAKIELSRRFQISSLRRAAGAIFISEYARKTICGELRLDGRKCTMIHHGISDAFRIRPQERDYAAHTPMKILYVSHFYPYKHPWNVVEAVAGLRAKGYEATLDLVGAGNAESLERLRKSIRLYDPDGRFVRYLGNQPYSSMAGFYKNADVFVYASTCENMPNILIEAMSSAVPIASSRSAPMPEFLGDAGVYFDAEQPESIAGALEKLLVSETLRRELGRKAYEAALAYDWKRTAERTFDFIGGTYENHRRSKIE